MGGQRGWGRGGEGHQLTLLIRQLPLSIFLLYKAIIDHHHRSSLIIITPTYPSQAWEELQGAGRTTPNPNHATRNTQAHTKRNTRHKGHHPQPHTPQQAIWEELQGAVHAVDAMTTKTPAEAK